MTRTTPAHADGGDKSNHGDRWFATFTFLDMGCAISSSQYGRALTMIVSAWRRIAARVTGLKNTLNRPRCIGC